MFFIISNTILILDIKECLEMNPMPCRSGKCINTPGSFRCECPPGLRTMGAAIACEGIIERIFLNKWRKVTKKHKCKVYS